MKTFILTKITSLALISETKRKSSFKYLINLALVIHLYPFIDIYFNPINFSITLVLLALKLSHFPAEFNNLFIRTWSLTPALFLADIWDY